MKASDLINVLKDVIAKEGDKNHLGIDNDGTLGIIEGIQVATTKNQYGGCLTVLKFDYFQKDIPLVKEKPKEKPSLIVVP